MTTTVDVTDYVAGDSIRLDFTVEQSDGTIFPDLDDCEIEWRLDQVTPLGPGANLLSKSLEDGIELVDAENGLVAVSIAAGEIASLGAMLHALIVTTQAGDVYTVARGEFTASASL